MHRIDTATAEADTHGTGKDGHTNGVAPVTAPTQQDEDFFNALQEELAAVPEGIGATLRKGVNRQLISTIRFLIAQTSVQEFAEHTVGTDDLQCAAHNGKRAVMMGAAGIAFVSPDGDPTTVWGSPASQFGADTVLDVQSDDTLGGLFVAVGTSGKISTSSDDGQTWVARTADGSYAGNFRSVAFGNSLWVAAGSSGEIQTSPDGITWTARTSGTGVELTAVAYGVLPDGTGRWVCLERGAAGTVALYSTDAITWTAGSKTSGNIQDCAFGNGRYVAAGSMKDAGGLLTSEDGITWTDHGAGPVSITAEVGQIEFEEGVFWMGCNSGGVIFLTPDGEVFKKFLFTDADSAITCFLAPCITEGGDIHTGNFLSLSADV